MVISNRTLLGTALACLLASASSAAATNNAGEVDRTTRRARRVTRALARAESRIWGRNLQGDACLNQIDGCFDLAGCMLCMSITSTSGGTSNGHQQCVSVAGNEDLFNAVNFSGCCAEVRGGQNGKGETCAFHEHASDAE